MIKISTLTKTVLVLFSLILILPCISINALAGTQVYNWYCVHKNDHSQPKADALISFVENYDGYYIDHTHGDDCDDKVIYLTFDAGYENGNVEKILDIMRDEEVTGAFFILGHLIHDNTDLVKRMFNEGHLVCNHTFSHKTMVGKSKDELSAELSRLEQCCLDLTGQKMAKYYRPPEGKFDETSMQYAQELGYKTVFWSFAYADWDNGKQPSPEKAKKKILDNIHNGEIMLLHPTSSTNAAIIGDIICELKSQGYRFGSLDELGRP